MIFLKVLALLFLTNLSFGQTYNINGTWSTPNDLAVIRFEFDSTGTAKNYFSGCLLQRQFTGHFTIEKDSIFVVYDTLTTIQMQIYHLSNNHLPDDTLMILNKNKIRLNKHIILYNPKRDLEEFKVESNGLLNCKIRNFEDTFFISQYRFYRWEIIDTLMSPFTDYLELNDYQLPIHSGMNDFRIEVDGRTLKWFHVESSRPKVKLKNRIISDNINFSTATLYKLYDHEGNILLNGKGQTIDCSHFPSGKYILFFDNRMVSLKKKYSVF